MSVASALFRGSGMWDVFAFSGGAAVLSCVVARRGGGLVRGRSVVVGGGCRLRSTHLGFLLWLPPTTTLRCLSHWRPHGFGRDNAGWLDLEKENSGSLLVRTSESDAPSFLLPLACPASTYELRRR